jgi:hypothetical protein
LKYKCGRVGGKQVSDFRDFSFYDLSELSVGNRLPILVNTYKRRYFSTPDGICRVTIDKKQRFYSLESACMGKEFSIDDNRIVLEVKFDKEFLMSVADSLQKLGWLIGKNSKYVNGINSVKFMRSTY